MATVSFGISAFEQRNGDTENLKKRPVCLRYAGRFTQNTRQERKRQVWQIDLQEKDLKTEKRL